MSEYRIARVLVRGIPAGVLCETDAGYAFEYYPGYLASEKPSPVSLTLPLTDKVYESETCAEPRQDQARGLAAGCRCQKLEDQ